MVVCLKKSFTLDNPLSQAITMTKWFKFTSLFTNCFALCSRKNHQQKIFFTMPTNDYAKAFSIADDDDEEMNTYELLMETALEELRMSQEDTALVPASPEDR